MSDRLLRYKYVPLDDSFKNPPEYKNGSLCIIKDGTIKFTDPREFNDPFDCHPEIDFSNSFRKDFWRNIGNEMGFSPAKRIQEKQKLIKKLERNNNIILENMKNNIGVCSLSRDPLNLLMWAHYASSHTGFVVEFSIPTKLTTHDDLECLFPFPVSYKINKPVVNNPDLRLETHVLTKGKDWEYE